MDSQTKEYIDKEIKQVIEIFKRNINESGPSGLETKIDGLETKIDGLVTKDYLETKIDQMQQNLDDKNQVFDAKINTALALSRNNNALDEDSHSLFLEGYGFNSTSTRKGFNLGIPS